MSRRGDEDDDVAVELQSFTGREGDAEHVECDSVTMVAAHGRSNQVGLYFTCTVYSCISWALSLLSAIHIRAAIHIRMLGVGAIHRLNSCKD